MELSAISLQVKERAMDGSGDPGYAWRDGFVEVAFARPPSAMERVE